MLKIIVSCLMLVTASTVIATGPTLQSKQPQAGTRPPPPKVEEFKKTPIKIPPHVPVAQEFYPNPGIVSLVHGKWVGSDHLLNVPNHIGINIELLQPENSKVNFQTADLQKKISDLLAKAQIVSVAEARKDGPPLPFLHILIMLFPIDKGYAAYVGGRLFEEIDKRHVQVSGKTALQAITWERQTLIIFPTESLEDQITKTVTDIIGAFIERYEFFEKYKPKSENS